MNKMTETTDGILRKGIICFAVFFTISLLYLTYNLSDIFTELILQIPYFSCAAPVIQPIILGWNGFFGSAETANVIDFLRKRSDLEKCPYKCQYVSNKELAKNASIIIFHARDDFGQLPSEREQNQLYTFFVLESPVHTSNRYKQVPRDFFNISITYRADSDVVYAYDTFESLNGTEAEEEDAWADERKVAMKRKLALQFVSNCATSSRRETFVAELQKYINITEFGACVGKMGCQEECMKDMIDSHFFYLAFENSVCHQYVTEKFWHLKQLIVPVVLSRRVLANLTIPSDSFIAADDFKNAQNLAEHLQMLANNREQYMSYFNWTRQYKRTMQLPDPLCKLCKLAVEMPAGSQYRIKDIAQWWEDDSKCVDRFSEEVLLHGEEVRKNGQNNH